MSSPAPQFYLPPTPGIVKWILGSLFVGSLAGALVHELSFHNEITDPLTMSLDGLGRFYLWQPLTSLFVQTGFVGLNFVIHVLMMGLITWQISISLCEQISPRQLLWLYLGSGVFSSAVLGTIMALAKQPFESCGSYPALLGLIAAYGMLFAERQLSLFFVIQMQAKWAACMVVLATLIIQAFGFTELWPQLIQYGVAILFSYISCILIWKLRSPFRITHWFDNALIRIIAPSRAPAAKIYDFKTGRPLESDDDFMDKMLSKISTKGQKSLSRAEQERMQAISKKKKES